MAVVVSRSLVLSSLAYQGGARGLGIDEVEGVNRFATGGLVPDLTFLLELDTATAARRTGERDRFEDEGTELQQAVLEAYERLVAADPGRWRRLDATRARAGPPEVLAEVQAARSSSARMTVPLACTEDHPQAGSCCPPRRGRPPPTPICSTDLPAPASAPLRAAFAAELLAEGPTSPTRLACGVQHGSHPTSPWSGPTGPTYARGGHRTVPCVSAATAPPSRPRAGVVLDARDTMNDEVANRLLKTLGNRPLRPLILLTDALGR